MDDVARKFLEIWWKKAAEATRSPGGLATRWSRQIALVSERSRHSICRPEEASRDHETHSLTTNTDIHVIATVTLIQMVL